MPAYADSANLAVQVLATHSGGLVLNKNEDLPAQIGRCLEDARSFYEVTFEGAPGDRIGVYRPLKLTVDAQSARVRTDSAYYARLP